MYEATGSRYPGSRPFQDNTVDRIIFRGREKEKARLLQLILAEKLVVLYAKSGMGKTSLLNAGVFQALRLRGYFPFALRLNDPEKAPTELIYEAIEGAAEMHGLEFESGNKGTLWQYFKTTEFWSKKDVLYTPVLVFDQFEEIFTLGFSEKQKKEFFIELADLVRGTMPKSLKGRPQIPRKSPYSDKPPNIKIVISIREDFLGDLEELADDIPTILRNRFRLIALTQEQAQKAIEEPAGLKNKQLQTRRFSYTKRAINTMIKFLSEGRKGKEIVRTDEIELFQLQVLCQHIEKKVITKKLATTKKILKKKRKRSKIFNLLFQYTQKKILLLEQKTENKNLQMKLWRNIEKWLAHKMKKPGSKIRIAPDDFGGLSGMQRIWRNFYDTQIKQFTFWKRRAVRILCETGLISSTGRRLSLEAEMIKEKFRVSTDILSRLIANRLLRVEPRLNGFYYELSHDNLVSPIKRSSKNRRVKTLVCTGVAIVVFVVSLQRYGLHRAKVQQELKYAEAESERKRADGLRIEGKLEQAIDIYGKALKLNPEERRTHSGLALAYIKLPKYDKALEVYRGAVQKNQEFFYIYDSLRVALEKVKVDNDKAARVDSIIGTIAANEYNKLGKSSFDNKKSKLAKYYYEEALKLNPQDPETHTELAITYIQLEKPVEAVKFYLKAIRLDSANADKISALIQRQNKSSKISDKFYNILGDTLKDRGQLEKAIDEYKKAEKSASYADILADSARAYRKRMKYDQAVTAFTNALKWVGSDSTKAARLHTSRGLTYWLDVKTDSAKSDFRRAIELNPAYSTPHHHLAGILMAQDSLEKALKLSFKVTDKLASTDTLHWDRLAKIYSRMGNNKKEKTSEAEAKRLRSKQVATKN